MVHVQLSHRPFWLIDYFLLDNFVRVITDLEIGISLLYFNIYHVLCKRRLNVVTSGRQDYCKLSSQHGLVLTMSSAILEESRAPQDCHDYKLRPRPWRSVLRHHHRFGQEKYIL